MAFIGRLHPLIIHFPIALILVAAGCEAAALVSPDRRWRAAALVNLRAGAVFAAAAVLAGWRLASAPGVEPSSLLEWHRWLGSAAALLAIGTAVATRQAHLSTRGDRVFRYALFCAALFVAAAGHLGGLLVWGADFLRL